MKKFKILTKLFNHVIYKVKKKVMTMMLKTFIFKKKIKKNIK